MFTLASLVLHVFEGHPVTTRAIHRNGDLMDCRLANLEAGTEVYHASQGERYWAEADPAATNECRKLLAAARVQPDVIEHGLTGRDFSRRGRNADGWADPDACIQVLVEAGVEGSRIAAGMGLLPRAVAARRVKMGIQAQPRLKPNKLPGEAWRAVPGFRAKVSSLGRFAGPTGLVTGSQRSQRCRVTLHPCGGGAHRLATLANVVFATFKGLPLDINTRHLNGDPADCRLVNLERLDGKEIIRDVKRKDHPWTAAEDRALRKVKSWQEGVEATGHTLSYVKKRMTRLGITLETPHGARRGKMADLSYRDMNALERAVEVLQAMGVSDRRINLGLRITPHAPGDYAQVLASAQACALTLSEAGWNDRQAAAAMGVQGGTVGEYLRLAGVRERWPAGASTKRGPVDYQEGEEWRDIPGLAYSVSNMGRVANSNGDLMSLVLNPRNRYHVCLNDPARRARRYTALVSRLVLAAFKPELNARQAAYLNGDIADIRPENLVPRRTSARVDGPTSVSQPGPQRGRNTSGRDLAPARGSVPYFDPIWAEASAACPKDMDEHVREDLISDMVMLFMEGRAHDMPAALKLARREYNQRMGVWKERSLDAELTASSGFKLLDLLSDTGEIAPIERASRGRS